MEKQIVIIRYNEDVSWAECLDNVIIYNKGTLIDSKHKVVNLPNLGMYHASQFYHCIENYDNLADKTLFIQGNPWDGDFEIKYNFKNNPSDVKRLVDRYFNFPKNEEVSDNNFWILIGDRYNCPSNYNQRHHGFFITYDLTWHTWLNEYLDPLNKIDWYKNTRFYRNGHIALSRDAIRSNCKEYYIKIMQHMKYDVPILEWISESCLNFIFNIDNNGNIVDLGHNYLNFDNLEDYNIWHGAIE